MDSKQSWNIILLLLLYFLQGVPLGLSAAIPMMLASRNISYRQQAMFSLVYWPFSIKLLWAPIVDVLYVSSIGRRKSWLIPVQLLLGLVLLLLSGSVDLNTELSVTYLTSCFFLVNFLAATQDIAVDGWALSLLSRELVGYASTCNSVGQTAGYFVGFMLLLALESQDFTNAYIRTTPADGGLVTLGGFMAFWGVVFIVVTLTLSVLKKESTDNTTMTLSKAYSELWKIIKKEIVLEYCLIVFTSKIAFAASDSISHLKLINAGVPKQNLALLAVPIAPLQIILPWFYSRYTVGPYPMDLFVKSYPYRLIFIIINAMLVHFTIQMGSEFSSSYYFIILFISLLHQLTVIPMFVACMAYHNVVSDPLIGGTYMTLLNTLMNISGNWPATASLWLVDYVTIKNCIRNECTTQLDGYYILTGIGFVVGCIWIFVMGKRLRLIQRRSRDLWKCSVPN
ncbi:Acetyl-coenzyme A transporter 1 [Oopsacas minuta]|uniref:Acetyl-coenzyme A transporter 1 n=1 Tax=Oopsacas minuta TaxID=111878 RepID=A0AAV7KCV4_9METZ|nr:Acetyl-coenzyme A transporter 1 [Oopsacas minuta]